MNTAINEEVIFKSLNVIEKEILRLREELEKDNQDFDIFIHVHNNIMREIEKLRVEKICHFLIQKFPKMRADSFGTMLYEVVAILRGGNHEDRFYLQEQI